MKKKLKNFKKLLENLSPVAVVLAVLRFSAAGPFFAWNSKNDLSILIIACERRINVNLVYFFQFLLVFLMRIKWTDFHSRCIANCLQKYWRILSIIQRNKSTGAIYPSNENGPIFAKMMNQIGLLPLVGEFDVKHVVTSWHGCKGSTKRKTITDYSINNWKIYLISNSFIKNKQWK